ncbi:MAG: DUF1993 domain-containing protein [Proteobacteria bacterium]|nr:DUF1993 domain-containing protein [Pseudomonadota bacterium]
MSLSMYQASLPVFTQMLTNLSAILKKADAYAASKKIDPSVLLQSRLFPDMFPLTRQVQIASDMAKGGAARLAGIEMPSFPDNEASFADLQARIEKTLAFIKGIGRDQIDGTEERDIELKVGGREMKFKGQPYLVNFVLPNLYFHITTAYGILRHNGVELGKGDFLGAA